MGFCSYGYKCRFAHSRDELAVLPSNQAFRKKKCQGYWNNGQCHYGLRCQFGHSRANWENKVCILGISAWNLEHKNIQEDSKLLRMLE